MIYHNTQKSRLKYEINYDLYTIIAQKLKNNNNKNLTVGLLRLLAFFEAIFQPWVGVCSEFRI